MITLLILFMAPLAMGQENDAAWPSMIDHPQAKITIYQPQLESFKENILESRAGRSSTTKAKPKSKKNQKKESMS